MDILACCGLECDQCPARVATLEDDQGLREETARQWSAMFQAEIKPEEISCMGCNSEGPWFGHCHVCEIRACCQDKGLANCAPCGEFPCHRLDFVFKGVPQARENLLAKRGGE